MVEAEVFMKTVFTLFLSGLLFASASAAPDNHKDKTKHQESFVHHETSGKTWTQRGHVAKRAVTNAAKDTGNTLDSAGHSVISWGKRTF